MEEHDNDIAAVGLLEERVRRALYEWVVDQPTPVGREHAAQAVGTTRSLAAFHLEKLVDGGLLNAGYRRLTGRSGPGAGRPARVYWRAPREISINLPERHYARAADILATALERVGGGSAEDALADAARDAGRAMAARAADHGHRRLQDALADGGYEPLAEEGGTIRLRNCPFDALARDHRQLVCGANLALAEGLTEAAGEADLTPRLDPQPGFCCVSFVPRDALTPPSER